MQRTCLIQIYLINYETSEILGHTNLFYSSPYKVQDIEFVPQSCNSFVVCGLQTMQIWTLKGGLLSYSNL